MMFDKRTILWLRIGQLVGIVAIAAVGIARLIMSTRRSRLDFWVIIVAVKSLVFMAYEVGTDKVQALRRFGSLRAYMILNVVELVFWIAAVALQMVMLNSGCSATGCVLTGVVAILAVLLAELSVPILVASIQDHRYYRRHGSRREENVELGDEYAK